MALRDDARRDPPDQAQPGREVSARAADGLRSHSKIAAQERPQGRAGSVLCTPRLRARDLAKRGEDLGGQRGTGHLVPDMSESGASIELSNISSSYLCHGFHSL